MPPTESRRTPKAVRGVLGGRAAADEARGESPAGKGCCTRSPSSAARIAPPALYEGDVLEQAVPRSSRGTVFSETPNPPDGGRTASAEKARRRNRPPRQQGAHHLARRLLDVEEEGAAEGRGPTSTPRPRRRSSSPIVLFEGQTPEEAHGVLRGEQLDADVSARSRGHPAPGRREARSRDRGGCRGR